MRNSSLLRKHRLSRFSQIVAVGVVIAAAPLSATEPTRDEVRAAMRKAAEFFHREVASGGGYVWRYSGDLEYRQGEAVATRTMIWVRPPGTPAVADALLDAFEATADRSFLDAAKDAARALVRGQLISGGWDYHIGLGPQRGRQEGGAALGHHRVVHVCGQHEDVEPLLDGHPLSAALTP